MNQSPKVLWGEGLFLRPQHFQRQDAYHEWRTGEFARALHPFAWGVRQIQIDSDALATGTLAFKALQLVFPDGEMYSAPAEDALPAPVALASIAPGTAALCFHASIATLRPNGRNFSAAEDEPDGSLRYEQRTIKAADWFTGAAASNVAVLSRCVRVMADDERRDHLLSLPLCRLRRTPTGGFEIDPHFVPPSMSIAASSELRAMLRRLLDVLQAKVEALYGFHREPSRHVIEFRSGDVASFWLLHTASTAFAGLSHLQANAGLHPERLYERMLELAGALLTFSKTFSLADLPPYEHASPGENFARLDTIVRELLETVISTRCFSIALEEVKPSFHHARLASEKIGAATHFYLGATAAMPAAELIEAVPARFKAGAPDDVEKLVLSALRGVPLAHAAQVPAAVPVRPGACYFALEPRGPLYERMLKSGTLALYVPAGMDDLKIELFALNP